MSKKIPYRTYLSEEQMPKYWYNLRADMKEQHDPYVNPGTMKPIQYEDLLPVFCEELVKQEMNTTERYIAIPEEVREFYKTYRPSPLIRAYNLEKELKTPAKIYYKFEGNNTSGSHKLNSAVAQVYYAKMQGITSLTTETGAGQWGTALSMAAAYFNMPLTVFMVKVSAEQKPYRKAIMETFGAKVIPSPSDTTDSGKAILKADPKTGGSLGCAISEAVEQAVKTPNCRYVLGSVLDQVLLHQAIMGSEAKIAMELLDEYPDVVIGCIGGGSNFGGIISEYMADKLNGRKCPRFIAVEPASCPSLTRGKYAYDFCDTGKITPLAKMYTLGSGFKPSPIHAGGLRYHGDAPIVCNLAAEGLIEARAYYQNECFEAARLFLSTEGFLPAPETSHAIKAVIDLAKEAAPGSVITFLYSGHGLLDLASYEAYLKGGLTNFELPQEDIDTALKDCPEI